MPELSSHATAGLAHARATAPQPLTGGFTLFAYGAMVASQPFPVAGVTVARAQGHRRTWSLHDPVRRGTAERPGRVLGLEPDGTCAGVAIAVDADHADGALQEIFAQEMLLPWYRPAWLPLNTPAGSVTGLAFLTDPQSPHVAPVLPPETLAWTIATRAGPGGPNAEYLRETAEGLRAHDIPDPELEALMERVRRMAA